MRLSVWATDRTAGKTARLAGSSHRRQGIARRQALAGGESVERPHRRQPLPDGATSASFRESGEIRAQDVPCRRAPVVAVGREPGQIRLQAGPVGADRVERRSAGIQRLQKPLGGGLGGRIREGARGASRRSGTGHRGPGFAGRFRTDGVPRGHPPRRAPADLGAAVFRPPDVRAPLPLTPRPDRRRGREVTGLASAAGFGSPPGSLLPTISPAASSTAAPQIRHRPASPARPTGPSSASWTAPTGSCEVV